MTVISDVKYCDVIKSIVRTEKSSVNKDNFNKYTLKVDGRYNKTFFKRAFEELFGVQVEKINSLNYKSKKVTFKGRKGEHAGYKKIVVSVAKGQKVDFNFKGE